MRRANPELMAGVRARSQCIPLVERTYEPDMQRAAAALLVLLWPRPAPDGAGHIDRPLTTGDARGTTAPASDEAGAHDDATPTPL